ncbi:unnamed protein product [Ilex paraguariensis]|uniref:Uncharacterized protein n=1 Tax=Ilex paraguariensis TaxID=185542 RepID=A0ABC8QLT9_9AQUA
MGNRFIKLMWANRDSIPDDGMSSSNSMTVGSVPPQSSGANRGKDVIQSTPFKSSVAHASVIPVPASDHPKPVVANGPRAQPPSKKKLDEIELLKKEVRKKQEMLDQKRNDLRLQLDLLEKQGKGLKGEASSEQAAKRHKAGAVADVAKFAASRSVDPGTVVSSLQAEVVNDNGKAAETHSSKSSSIVALPEPSSVKSSIRPLASVGAAFINRFKLDNRPTAFKIIPPLPTGLTNVIFFSITSSLPLYT